MRVKLRITVVGKSGAYLDCLIDHPCILNKGRKDGPWYKVRYMGRDYRLEEKHDKARGTTHVLRLGTSLPSKLYSPDH